MQANHSRHVEQMEHAGSFEFDFSESDLRFIQTHESRGV
jgi:hypothetical protein